MNVIALPTFDKFLCSLHCTAPKTNVDIFSKTFAIGVETTPGDFGR